MVRGVRWLKENSETDFFLLSNSNEVYIHTILEVGAGRRN